MGGSSSKSKKNKESEDISKKVSRMGLTDDHCHEEIKITVDNRLSDFPLKAWEKLSVNRIVKSVNPINPYSPMSLDCIRFVCISDTHTTVENKHDLIPDGDVLLHAGDFTMRGIPAEIDKFNTFLGTLSHKVKVVIAGNHDMTLDDSFTVEPGRSYLATNFRIHENRWEDFLKKRNIESSKDLLTNCVYLKDSTVSVCGINIYGAPWVPEFCFMGFNVARGQDLLDKWNLIPSNTDILVTHGPPLGYGDLCFSGERAGCLELLNTIQKRVKPRYHVYGHIHEGHGVTTDGTTTFVNAAMCNLRYQPRQSPIVFDYQLPEGHTRDELLNKFTPVASTRDEAHCKQGKSSRDLDLY